MLQTVDIDKDEILTLHFKKLNKLVEVKAKHIADNLSLHNNHNSDVYHVDFYNARQKYVTSNLSWKVREAVPDKTNPGTNIQSVQDVEWREQKFEYKHLAEYYKMLSKMRLTGTF